MRRIFWGRSVAQAVAKAARHHRVAPEQLAWRRYEKRHGFVKHQRAVLIEVDPEALLRGPGSAPAALAERPADLAGDPGGTSTKPAPAPEPARDRARNSVPASAPPARAPKIVAPRNAEPYDTPEEESEMLWKSTR